MDRRASRAYARGGVLAVGIIVVATVIGMLTGPLAQRASAVANILILGPTVSGSPSLEQTKATALGYSVEVASAAQWAAKSQSDFAQYKAIVLGDGTCTSDSAVADAAANRATWVPAVTGNVVIVGTDPVFHQTSGSLQRGTILTEKVIAFAAAGSTTGLYFALSCYSETGTNSTNILNQLASGFTRSSASGNAAHIVASHPALAGLTDANLENWTASVHSSFSAWPSTYTPLAIIKTSSGVYTAGDATVGNPYIVAKGAGLVAAGAAPPPAQQYITFAALPDRTVLESPLTLSASASSGLPVSFTSHTKDVCTVAGTTVTLLTTGTCTVMAHQTGSAWAAAYAWRSFAVTRAPQTIDTISIADHFVGEAPTTLTGSASSGLPVSVNVSGACVLTEGKLSFTKEGDCVITQAQAGDATYLPAADVKRTIKVKVLRPPVQLVTEAAPAPAPSAPTPSAPTPTPAPVPMRSSPCGAVPSGTPGFLGRPGYHSAWAGQSQFISAAPGQPFEYCLVLRNTGTLPWLSGTRSTQINLGANTPQDSTAYVDRGILSQLYERNRFATAQEDVVRPGEYATFIIKGRAPATAGVQRIDVAPVIDGVQWLEDEGIYFLIAVR